ncbi:MAG: P-loop NTPase [Bdellovibrionales bacterium]|nr:P-loop NTPase [Bdellovibrionales bacterium]
MSESIEATANMINNNSTNTPTIIAVGGGKGGIGKSFFTSNLAIYLSRFKKVTVVDLDLGSSNQHTCLGLQSVRTTISDFLSDKIVHFQELEEPTRYINLKLVSGCFDSLNITQLTDADVQKLIAGIKTLNSDIVILDLGAGTAAATVDFFTSADNSILVASAEPTSIENAYRFLKVLFYRKLQHVFLAQNAQEELARLLAHRDQFQEKSPNQIVKDIYQRNHVLGRAIMNDLQSLDLSVVLNQIRMSHDEQVGHGIASVCNKFFGVWCKYLGAISYDDAVWQSLRKSQPVMIANPQSSVSQQISKIAKNLVGSTAKTAVL